MLGARVAFAFAAIAAAAATGAAAAGAAAAAVAVVEAAVGATGAAVEFNMTCCGAATGAAFAVWAAAAGSPAGAACCCATCCGGAAATTGACSEIAAKRAAAARLAMSTGGAALTVPSSFASDAPAFGSSSRMRSSALRLTHRSWYPSSASSTGAPAFPVTWEERFTPLTAGANSPRHAATKTMWRSILPNYGRPRLLREATPSSFTSFLAFLLFHLLINGCNTRIETRFFTETTYSSSSFCWSFRLGRGHRQRAHHGLPAEHPPLCADHADHHPVLYYRRHRQLGSMGAFNEPRFQPGRPRGRAGEDGGGSGVFFFLVELAALAGSKYGFAGAQALESLFQGLAALGRLAAVLFPCWPRRWQGPCLRADFPPSPFSSAFWVSPQSPLRPTARLLLLTWWTRPASFLVHDGHLLWPHIVVRLHVFG